jgi:hypothetical protein
VLPFRVLQRRYSRSGRSTLPEAATASRYGSPDDLRTARSETTTAAAMGHHNISANITSMMMMSPSIASTNCSVPPLVRT